MLKSIKANDAIDILLSKIADLKTETVDLNDALGRVIVSDYCAAFSMPPFDKSPFDGYAIIAEDTKDASGEKPVTLSVLGEIPAGTPAGEPLKSGQVVKILTGAPIPLGANATIKYEDVVIKGDKIILSEKVKPDSNVVRSGENYMKGDILVKAGSKITPPMLAILATQGADKIEVYRKPTATVISTGSELVEVGKKINDAQIYSSNYFALYGYLTEIGFDVKNGGIAVDDLDVISQSLTQGLETSDVVITTGGASVGDYDFAVRGAENIGANTLFWKVKLKPGGAFLAAEKDGKMIISLSGNPGAAMMGFLMIASPFLRKLCGRTDFMNQEVMIPLLNSVEKPGKVSKMMRGHIVFVDGKAFLSEHSGFGNGDMFAYINCEYIAEIPASEQPIPAGTLVKAYKIYKNSAL